MPGKPANILITGDTDSSGLVPLDSLIQEAAKATRLEPKFDVVVIDDLGGQFRETPDSWPAALTSDDRNGFIIHKMGHELANGGLWEYMSKDGGPDRLTTINADDLRAMEGVNISQGLSWEHTAKDFSYQIRTLKQFSCCPLLIVLFGIEGAILYRNETGQEAKAVLVFDPLRLEGDLGASGENHNGDSISAFTAALTCHVARHGTDQLETGVTNGLCAARTRLGGESAPCDYQICEIEPARYGQDPDPDFWRIVDQQTQNTRLLVAEEIVCRGKTDGLNAVPRAKFGALETIDRAEIESYGAIRELLAEYIDSPNPSRPLCIAVFGPPGAGKSFGVKQVMKSLQAPAVTAKTFNISQYSGYADLVTAFHEVRNIAESKQLPFIFFDEFDSALNGEPLAWLASFLAPMNDGEFKDGDLIHPIGKAIFVFAGGTKPTLAEFSQLEDKKFKDVKGPDFVSRLRGFVNVMGPNRQHERDDAYILRRAKVLRSNFVRNSKAKNLLDENGVVQVDPGVLRAMLHISEYKHGMRSMDAVLDMSRIGNTKRFNLASLPPKEQLDLHVDADEFLWLTQNERYQTIITPQDWVATEETSRIDMESEFVDRVAQQVFLNVIKNRKIEGKDVRLDTDWDNLSEQDMQSFRDSAEDIPRKLRVVNHSIRRMPESESANVPDISDKELESLARLEHDRRCQFLRLNGYSYAEETDKSRNKSSRLVPFEHMPPDRVNHYIQGIYAIPVLLQTLGYEIYRMEEHDSFTDRDLLDLLARLVHDDYVAEEEALGKTVEDNESLVPFDELPADKIASNLDNAASIPKKLRRINYRMVKLRPGDSFQPLKLSDDQIEELAQMEHSRWVWHSLMQGWVYDAKKKNKEAKTNPCILPWDQLDDEIKKYDFDTVNLIPVLLERAGYKAVPTS